MGLLCSVNQQENRTRAASPLALASRLVVRALDADLLSCRWGNGDQNPLVKPKMADGHPPEIVLVLTHPHGLCSHLPNPKRLVILGILFPWKNIRQPPTNCDST